MYWKWWTKTEIAYLKLYCTEIDKNRDDLIGAQYCTEIAEEDRDELCGTLVLKLINKSKDYLFGTILHWNWQQRWIIWNSILHWNWTATDYLCGTLYCTEIDEKNNRLLIWNCIALKLTKKDRLTTRNFILYWYWTKTDINYMELNWTKTDGLLGIELNKDRG